MVLGNIITIIKNALGSKSTLETLEQFHDELAKYLETLEARIKKSGGSEQDGRFLFTSKKYLETMGTLFRKQDE